MSDLIADLALLFCCRLQEVETEQYYSFFLPELKEHGYDGFFSPKSRARTMSESDRKHVDGCAIFFKTEKYAKYYGLFFVFFFHPGVHPFAAYYKWLCSNDLFLLFFCKVFFKLVFFLPIFLCLSPGSVQCRSTRWSSTSWPWLTPRALRLCWTGWWQKTTLE